jgi:hypothetical protein
MAQIPVLRGAFIENGTPVRPASGCPLHEFVIDIAPAAKTPELVPQEVAAEARDDARKRRLGGRRGGRLSRTPG